MKKLKSKIAGAGLGLVFLASVSTAGAVPVNLELLLLADVSGSLNANDFNLQRGGLAAAFQDATVQTNIASLTGGIAVSLVYWSSGQAQVVPWTHITNAASANAFAAAINAAPRPFSGGGTAMTAALNFGAGLFANNGFEGTRQTIDISGDGAENTSATCLSTVSNCVPLQNARDAALAGGIDTINALWIEDEAQPSSRKFFCLAGVCTINPLTYGTTNVIGGTDNFQLVVASFDQFAAGAVQKIGREIITPVPEPGTLLMLGIALAVLAFARRRRSV